MAVNIKTFVRAGGLYPGGFNGVTLLFQTICDRFFDIAVPFSPISLALNAIPAIISFKAVSYTHLHFLKQPEPQIHRLAFLAYPLLQRRQPEPQ